MIDQSIRLLVWLELSVRVSVVVQPDLTCAGEGLTCVAALVTMMIKFVFSMKETRKTHAEKESLSGGLFSSVSGGGASAVSEVMSQTDGYG